MPNPLTNRNEFDTMTVRQVTQLRAPSEPALHVAIDSNTAQFAIYNNGTGTVRIQQADNVGNYVGTVTSLATGGSRTIPAATIVHVWVDSLARLDPSPSSWPTNWAPG